jgi:mercuric ion binding protein
MRNVVLAVAMFLPSLSFAVGKEIKVSVKGMVCGFCAQGIEKKFKTEEAIKKIDVSLENKLVTLELKEGKDIENGKIEKILKSAGYNVENIERPKK